MSMLEQKRVVVFGLGYVGSVTAACFAELGHAVTGVDKDDAKPLSSLLPPLSSMFPNAIQTHPRSSTI